MIIFNNFRNHYFLFSLIHWNWVFGGNWGLNIQYQQILGNKIFNPKIESSIVAIGLLVFGTYYFLISNLISIELLN